MRIGKIGIGKLINWLGDEEDSADMGIIIASNSVTKRVLIYWIRSGDRAWIDKYRLTKSKLHQFRP